MVSLANVELYDHQIKAVNELHNGAILCGGVGTGKSITSIAYFFTKVCSGVIKINGKGETGVMFESRDLLIVTTAKKRDSKEWEGDLAKFGLSKERDASFEGVGVKIISWNEITNYDDIKDHFIIFDEQRLVGSGAWTKSFIKMAKHNQWILLSATPGDNWMDYCPVFIANGWYKNRTEFVRQHVVYKNFSKFPKIERYVDTGILQQYRRRILVDMPYTSHTKRNIIDVIVDHDEVLFKKVVKERWNIYEHKPLKDVGEMFRVMRKLANSDPSRKHAVAEIMDKHDKLIIFYNFNFELDILRDLAAEMEIDVAEWNGTKHQPVPTSDRWLYLVQFTAGAEGWNCITTDAMIFYSLNYSYKINHQAKGRTDRLNTPYTDLYYYIIKSRSMIDLAIDKSLRGKQNFNEKAFFKGSSPW